MRYCDKHDRMFDEFAPCQGCAAAALGRLGGKAGRGEAKRRGDSAYYKALRARSKGTCAKCGSQTFGRCSNCGRATCKNCIRNSESRTVRYCTFC